MEISICRDLDPRGSSLRIAAASPGIGGDKLSVLSADRTLDGEYSKVADILLTCPLAMPPLERRRFLTGLVRLDNKELHEIALIHRIASTRRDGVIRPLAAGGLGCHHTCNNSPRV